MPNQVDGLAPGGADRQPLLDRGRKLILAAFDEARSSGRPDWHVMTIAVLKNRLLDITRRAFDEESYGVSSILEFVKLYPDLLSIESEARPPRITLVNRELLSGIESEEDEDASSTSVRTLIRSDLWRAMVDYASGDTYVWDTVAKIARVAFPGDTSPTLPTFSVDEMASLRAQFAESQRPSQLSAERLDEWVTNNYGSNFLPRPLRGRWNGFFREALLDRLRKRFEELHIEPPGDLVRQSSSSEIRQAAVAAPSEVDAASLRELVHRCVAIMSERELADLRISPATVVRALRRRK
jgi:hypothetical protein